MKKNGFTLTELLAVIVILGVITLIAIPTSFAVSNRIKIKLYCTKMETLKKAAEQYATDHYDEVNLGMINKVTVKNLVDYGYVEKDKESKGTVYIIDPRDNETSLDDITFALKVNNSRPKVTFEQESYYYLCGDDKLKDNKDPSCLYKGESTTWTNQNRTITISCYDAGSGCKTKDVVKTYKTTTKTDSINITMKDWVGRSAKCKGDLDVYVDKTNPTYEIVGEASNSSDWKNRRTITVKCVDDDSGCKTEDIKFEYGIGASDNSKRNVDTDTISFTLEDNAGNKKTYSKEVKVYTDVDNPTCSYSGESTVWSKESRSVQIICNDSRSGCKVASRSITIGKTQGNYEMNFIALDNAGNQTDCTKNLDVYVDTEKPTVTMKNITNNVATSQTVTLAMSDDIGIAEYYFGTSNPSNTNVTYTTYTANNVSQTVSNSGTYYFAAKDAAGNMSVTNKVFYKTTLNANGGSVSPTSVITLDGNTFSLPNATKNYYDFNGWYAASSGGTKQATSYKPTGNSTFYAQYSPTSYGITYNSNNSACGNGSSGNPSSYNIETANFTLKNPTCTGYTFNGWSGTGLSGSANTSVTVAKGSTGARTYTANWTINTYYLDLNGLLDGTSSGSIANFGTADVYINGTLVANDVTDYYTKHEYGTSYEIKDIKTAAGRTYNGVSSGSAKGTIGAGNVAVQLKYTTNTYTISYTLGCGTVSGNPTTYTVDTASFTLKNPTCTGHTFTGWTGSNGSTKQTSVTISKGSTGNKSYSANWSVNTYTVTCQDWFVDASNNGKVKLGESTKTFNYGASASGTAWGNSGSTGAYYSGYAYKSASSDTVPANNNLVVYRRFHAWTDLNIFDVSGNQNGATVSFKVGNGSWTDVTNESNTIQPYGTTYYITNIRPKSGQTLDRVENLTWHSGGYYYYTPTTANTSMNIYMKNACSFTSKDFGYTGGVQPWTVPDGCSGSYQFEVWGAQGGMSNGGKGGYAKGVVNLSAGTTIYIVVGGQGVQTTCNSTKINGGYNGGGYTSCDYYNGNTGTGGGATHIGTFNSTLAAHGNTSGLYIVAGGGGGGHTAAHDGNSTNAGGAGGGTTGGNGQKQTNNGGYGLGGTQTAGGGQATRLDGSQIENRASWNYGSFGQGGSQLHNTSQGAGHFNSGAGGGGGLYGGGAGLSNDGEAPSGGGGSSWTGGVSGGSMSSGQRSGSGYARITKVS